jgi:hypothetical protein
METYKHDELIPFRDVPALLPRRRRGKRVHVATIHRWATIGYRGIKLRFVQVGNTRCVRRDDLDEFLRRLTSVATGEPTPAATRSPAARRREIERANQDLDDMGV